MFVGANHAQHIARKNAHVAFGHRINHRVALYVHHIHTILAANVGIAQPLAHKGAAVTHGHVGKVQVAHQIVFTACATVLTLVHIVHKAAFHLLDAVLEYGREDRHNQDDHGQANEQRQGTRIGAIQDAHDEVERQEHREQRHYHQWHIGNTARFLDQLPALERGDAREDDGVDKWHDNANRCRHGQESSPSARNRLGDEGNEIGAAHEDEGDDYHRVEQNAQRITLCNRFPQRA